MLDQVHSLEIQRLYTSIKSRGLRSVAITACNSGEGVTSTAVSLAQRNILAGNTTLLVDLNLFKPYLTPELETYGPTGNRPLFSAPQLMLAGQQNAAITGIAAPSGRDTVMKLRSPGNLELAIKEWEKDFDLIIFDTSPINQINACNIPAESVAAACDGAFLMVLAGHTTKAQVSEGMSRLAVAGAQVIGSILNDQFNPSLKGELTREVKRLKRYCSWLAVRLMSLLDNNRLLNLDL